MTIKETDPTAPAPDDEPMTQSTPDLVIYHTPDPDPAAEIEAEEDDEAQAVFDDDVDPSDETEAVVEADDDVDLYDETESDAATDGQPEHNGDGQAEPEGELPDDPATQLVAIDGDPETLDPQDDTEVLEAPANGATEDRPFLSDGGVFEDRWNAIQIDFVDDPRQAVQSADHLITEAIDDLAKVLVNQRELLQAQWDDDVDTEQLRVVFRDYRALLLGLLHT